MPAERDDNYRPDEVDWKIVDVLKDYGRRTNTEIAAYLGLNETTVRKRIARLLTGRFMNVVAVPNPLRMGYTMVALIGITAEASRLEQVEASLRKLKVLRYIALTTGSFDFIAEAWFETADALRLFLVHELGKVPGVVKMETFHVLKLIRHLSDWGVPEKLQAWATGSHSRRAARRGRPRSTAVHTRRRRDNGHRRREQATSREPQIQTTPERAPAS
jgi:Lrp/AsnC family transcriptional regulator, regulator for asnA, asnC and gidA